MKNINLLFGIVAALVVGLLIGRYILPSGNGGDMTMDAGGDKKILYWVAPMDPNYRRDEPGKSPMGMDLIPVYAGGEMAGDSMVSIAPQVVQNIGVKSSPVAMETLTRSVETVGFVVINEDMTSHIHVRSPGWIEELLIKAEGERVRKGELLFKFYSPDISNAQSELIRALETGDAPLITASKSRLRALNVDSEQIETVIASRVANKLVHVYAPQDGIIASLNVAEGMHIQPGTTVLSLADLTSVWVNAEVYEDQSPWLADGARAMVHVPFMPERKWHGLVDYVYPTVDTQTRTVRARLVFENADLALKPGMYADVVIDVAPLHHALTIPRSALIQTGESNRVIVDMGAGMFRPVAVAVGVESGERVQILSGLKAGDKVVTSGQFLLDSEASLSGSFARMESGQPMDIAEDEMVPTEPERVQPKEQP